MSAAISVVIPTFNRAHVLGVALDSVLGQGIRDLDVIVVDDGSSDGTRSLVEAVIAADRRVQYRYQANSGAASARNVALDQATGAFIAFLDSDDSWKPWHLELGLAALARFPEAGLVWTDVDAVDATGAVVGTDYLPRLLSSYRYVSRDEVFPTSLPVSELGVEIPASYRDRRLYVGDAFSAMVMGNLIPPSSVLMRRQRLEDVGRFDEQLVTGEDYEFFLRACRAGPVALADVAAIRYMVGTSDRLSGLASGIPIARAYLEVLERTLAGDADRITLSPAMITEARAHAHRWVGEAELRAGSPSVARSELLKAFRLGRRRPWIILLLMLSLLPRSVVTRLIALRRRL